MTDFVEPELPGMPEHPEPPPAVPYIVKGSASTSVDISVDLAELIRKYPDEYRQVNIRGFDKWERPMRFLDEYMSEYSGSFCFGPEVTQDWADFEFDTSGYWTKQMFEDLCAACPEARIDP